MFGFSKMPKLSGHKNKMSGWPPPGPGCWGGLQGPPFSWDSMNSTREGRDCLTTQVSQSSSLEEVPLDGVPPAPRLVEMTRDPVLGFGFVAGSEKPVVVRSVTPGGPSEGRLLPGDEIIMINDEPVGSAPRERVIDLVRSCKESIMLTVVQPYPSPKSAFISAAKKAMLKSNPVKVRFAEEVIINGQVPVSSTTHTQTHTRAHKFLCNFAYRRQIDMTKIWLTRSNYVPPPQNPVKDNSLLFMPNVLKVYLENGQTKSFRFDAGTSVKDVILTLQEKLSIKCIEHFSLALEQRTGGSGSKLLLLHEQEMLTQVTQRPGSDKMKCFFRIGFVPRDPVELLRRDAVAFEYLYVQSCNDVVSERFGPELKYDAALRLAALQMYILTMMTRQSQKVSLKYIQKEWGLTPFLPPTVLSSTKEKNIKKALTHILKTNQNLVPPGKKLTALQAKVHYLRYLSELRLYGGREFKAILLQGEKRTEVMLLVGPRYGISHVINARTNLAALLADFSHVNRIEILTEDETDVRLELHVLDVRAITLIMESSDAMNLACLTAGYYRLLVDSRRSIFSMAHCNSTGGDDNCQDHIPEWPYSMSLGEDEGPPPIPAEVYDRDSQYSDSGHWENSISPYFHECENPERDVGMRRSPVPPPLPPATRHKTQDSPRCAKVSFIFGGDPPLNKHNNLGSERPSERPEVSEHGPPNADANRHPFQFAGLTHVYGNIVSVEGSEEPLLRDLFYRDTTDDAEDDEDGSCDEDSAGGTPANDNRGGEDENGVHRGGGSAAAAGKAMFLTLSCSTDDIIDLTSLPPPEGDDGVDEDDDDALLQTLNLAIAAPPPDFQDSSDEDAASDGKRPSAGDDDEDIPVSSIDSVPTHREEEGSSSGRGERRPENALTNTLRATEALSVCDRRPPAPASNSNNPGVYTTRGYSPESSSDSGNETNSSEMTEICELVATHRLRESHARLLVATREGYQPLPEEKTEFPVSPSTGGTIRERPPSPVRHLRPPAVPPRRSPLPDPPSSGPDDREAGAEAALRRPSSTTPGGKHQKKSTDSNGKYNTFSTREGHRGESDGRRLNSDRHALFREREESQRRQNSFSAENSIADGLGANSLPRDSQRVPRRPSSASDRPSDSGESGGADGGALATERDEHLVVASLPSPTKKFRSGGSDRGSDVQSERRPLSKQQSVARLCEYHLAKRISNLQGETHSSLQGSLCSSLDAGSTNSSACATPTDSPLGPCAANSKHPCSHRHPLSGSSSSLIRAVNYEDNKAGPFPSIPGQNVQGKDLHPHADPALLRKMLPNIHPPAARSESGRPSSATPTKRKETISCDPHAKHQAYFKGLSQKEGSEAYRQLINYLTVSQMHQGGKLHSAGGGGAAKKDNRRFITSNPQLVETVKSRGNVVARHPRTPSSTSSLFLSPSVAIGNSVVTRPGKQSSPSYRSATLPAKFEKSPDRHVQSPSDGLDRRSATVERRSSLSGLESEPERSGTDPERFPWPYNREGGFSVNRPPPRSKSQPCGSTEERFISEPRVTLSVRLSPPHHPNGRLVFSGDRRVDHDATSLGRGDHPSAFTPQMSTGGNRGTSPSPIATSPPPPPAADSGSGNLGRTRDLVQFQQNQSVGATPPQSIGDNPQRGREPKRSSNDAAGAELAFDKSTRSRRKRLSKSYSQGSVSSHATRWSTGSRTDGRRASVAFPLPKDTKHAKGPQKLDASPWRCNGPFSYCFFKRNNDGEEDDVERERPRSLGEIDDDARTCEQLYGEVLDNMSFSDRLSRINALKDRTYRFPSGFDDVRRDAAELAALVRSAVGRRDRGVPMPIRDASQYKRLLSAESKELGRACRRMALAHGSPEEMLLAITCSFQVLCCLCEACMCLVRGLGTSASQQQREVAAKADEVVANYVSLLKAAEAAAVGAPGEGSAKALVRHSGTMSAIVDALARSLKTLLSK